MSESIPKGPAAEEALRNYFLSIEYFVVRGCKFTFNGFDVTDVDLWLYGRSSPLSRERTNVDIKNKKTPQALERIFWAKGLQATLGFEACIVATTDMRPDVRDFGLQHQVKVLDGRFLGRLTKSERSHLVRIGEEQLLLELEEASMGRLGGDWKGRYEASKSRVLSGLTFDGCNAWIDDIHFFLEGALSESSAKNSAWRMVYISLAFFLIAVDFILREHLTAEQEQRRTLLENGFRYGSAGKPFTEKVGRLAAALVGSIAAKPGMAETLERELHNQAASLRAEILAEFFAKASVHSAMFEMARELEASAFAEKVLPPSAASPAVQAALGIFADFFALDRKRVLV